VIAVPVVYAAGSVRFGQATIGAAPGPNGGGVLAWVTFTPLLTGTTPLTLSQSIATSVSSDGYTLTRQNGALTIIQTKRAFLPLVLRGPAAAAQPEAPALAGLALASLLAGLSIQQPHPRRRRRARGHMNMPRLQTLVQIVLAIALGFPLSLTAVPARAGAPLDPPAVRDVGPGFEARSAPAAALSATPAFTNTLCSIAPPVGNPGKTLVASSGAQNIVSIYDQVSLNEQGDVAMAAVTSLGEALFVGRDAGGLRKISAASENSEFTLGPAVQINNNRRVVVRVRYDGAPPLTTIRAYNAEESSPVDTFDVLARSGLFGYTSVLAHASINDQDQVAFPYLTSGGSFGGLSTYPGYAQELSVGGLRPVINNQGRTVVRYGDTPAASIRILPFDLGAVGQDVVANVGEFSATGQKPSIDDVDDVVFYGDLKPSAPYTLRVGAGPGVFISVPGDAFDPARTVYRLAGTACNGLLETNERHIDLDNNGRVDPGEDQGFIKGFYPDKRVSIQRTNSTDTIKIALSLRIPGRAVFQFTFARPTSLQGSAISTVRLVGGDGIPGSPHRR
jgi:hypothetical protein